jgi:hypothetical protein
LAPTCELLSASAWLCTQAEGDELKTKTSKKQAVAQERARIEVCRSFSFKLNLDKFCSVKTFESREFFQSAKGECFFHDAEEYTQKLAAFCKRAVLDEVRAYIALIKSGQELSVQEDEARAELRMKQITNNATAKENQRAFEKRWSEKVRAGGQA